MAVMAWSSGILMQNASPSQAPVSLKSIAQARTRAMACATESKCNATADKLASNQTTDVLATLIDIT